jgi:DHA2 family multidrug resistance protein-like MFS transporter
VVWVVNIYQIAVAHCCRSARLANRRPSADLLGGLLLFTLASLGCAFAVAAQPDGSTGAAGTRRQRHHDVNAAGPFVYPTHMLGRGFSHNALWSERRSLRPTIASMILSIGTWPWLFAINIPSA